MFLTTEQVQQLTGYKYAKKQIEWLTYRGYKYDISADGKPKVLISYIETILGKHSDKKNNNTAPNFSILVN